MADKNVVKRVGKSYRDRKLCESITENVQVRPKIDIDVRPIRQNSQLQESVRISTWRAFFELKCRIPLERRPEKDESTRTRPPSSRRGSVVRTSEQPFIRSARCAWRMAGKSSPGNRVTGCKVMDTATHRIPTTRGIRAVFFSLSLSLSPPSLSMHVPLLPLGISTVWLPCSSSSTVFLHSSIAYCTTRFPPPPSFYSSLAIPPATNLHLVRLTSPETASAKLGFPLNPIVLLLRLVICPIPASSLSGFLYSTASSSPSRSAFRSSYSTHLHCVRRCSRINSLAELEDQAVSGCVFRAIDGINVILL